MNLGNYESMDPNLLVGLVNTTLRNDFDDLDDLVKTHDIDREILEGRLRETGFVYRPDLNQFRPGT